MAWGGRYAEARDVLEETRHLVRGIDDPLGRLRWLWVDAGILYGSGNREAAEVELLAVRGSFDEKGLRYDQAIASLEVARWYLDQGRNQEAEPLIDEAGEQFRRVGLNAKLAKAEALASRLTH